MNELFYMQYIVCILVPNHIDVINVMNEIVDENLFYVTFNKASFVLVTTLKTLVAQVWQNLQ